MGTFFIGPPETRPASIKDLFHALSGVPFLKNAFGIVAELDGVSFLYDTGRLDASQMADQIKRRLATLEEEPDPNTPEEERPPPAPRRLGSPDAPVLLMTSY